MTRPSGPRSDSAFPSDRDVDALRKRMLRHAQILDGALPGNSELLTGLPLCRGDIQSDVMCHLDKWKSESASTEDADLLFAAEYARAEATVGTVRMLRDRAVGTDSWYDVELVERCDIWLAYLGDADAQARVIIRAIAVPAFQRNAVDPAFRVFFASGITSRRDHDEYTPADSEAVLKVGMDRVGRLLPAMQSIIVNNGQDHAKASSLSKLRIGKRPSEDWDLDESDDAVALDVLMDDIKEDDDDDGRLVVVPIMPIGTSGQKDIRKSWKGLAGRALPLVGRGNVGLHRRELVARWPHAEDAIDVVLGDMAVREQVRIRPTLFVGSPGSGKSSLARAICDQVGLPCELTSLAGLADGSIMGTSAQWSTARESVPLQLVKRSGMASVAVIWDEIEKAGSGKHNGSALDALLPLLEMDQARRYRDPALEVEVNLSAVSHFATANSLDGIPAPVCDRFRIIVMPDPDWRHIGPITRQIVGRIADERGVDSRWFAPLAEDELDLVRENWPGGSIRKLTAIVKTIIDGRDRIIGSC